MNTFSSKNSHLLNFVYQFYSGMNSHEIILAYEGDISHQLMRSFAGVAEEKMNSNEEPSLVRQRMYHVMVECLRNISHHAFRDEDAGKPAGHNILLVTQDNGRYHVIAGNPVQQSKTAGLKIFLDRVNLSQEDDLDEMYKNQLLKGNLSEQEEACPGFIDIRRKTGHKLEYHFLPVDDQFSFFILDAVIPGKTT